MKAAKREVRARSYDGIDRRTVRGAVVLRSAGDGLGEVAGHACVFDDLSENLGYFDEWYESVSKSAFDAVLAKAPDVRALVNHDPNLLLARTTVRDGAGSLTLGVDVAGLTYRFVPTATSYAADLEENLRAGVVNQSSFAFRVASATWTERQDPNDPELTIVVRTIEEFSELYDVSPVTYPAYPTTDVGLSAADRSPAHDNQRDGDGPSAGERAKDEVDVDQQADEEPWRLRAIQRRMALHEPV